MIFKTNDELCSKKFYDLSSSFCNESQVVPLGCLNNDQPDRKTLPITLASPEWATAFPGGMTPLACARVVAKAGLRYFSLQSGSNCLGGNNWERATQYGQVHELGNCQTACSGNASEICGGPYRNSLYELNNNGENCNASLCQRHTNKCLGPHLKYMSHYSSSISIIFSDI